MVHYPNTTLDNIEKTKTFCVAQGGRAAIHTPHEMHCIAEFRNLIHKETGHWEENLVNQVCVFGPRELICR